MPNHSVVEPVYKGQTYEQPYRNGDCVGLPRAEKLCQEFASSGSESERDRERRTRTDTLPRRLGECENTGHFVSGSRMHTTDNTPAGDLFQRIEVKILAHGTSCLR